MKPTPYIREYMEAAGMTPNDLIEETGAERSTVYRWIDENPAKRTTPQAHWVGVLADIFDIEPNELYLRPDSRWANRFFSRRTSQKKAVPSP